MYKNFFSLLIFLLIPICSVYSNNVAVTNPSLVEQNLENHFIKIQFDLSWDNSWLVETGANNHDGVWLFVKYRKLSDGNWYHASLNTNVINNSTGSQGDAAAIQIPTDGKGAFFYRNTVGSGSFASSNIKFCWNYSTDGVGDTLTSIISEYKIYAIEMVYVPQNSFYIGNSGSETDHFYTYPTTTNPYQITSEAEIAVGTTDGNLYYSNNQLGGDRGTPIPASFPKGFNSFWCMKYEISQQQYADFLNTLTSTQKASRFSSNFNNFRCYLKLIGGVYGSDGNNNDILNENDDGQNIACNFLNWADDAAYADWAALRPMTELEFEKACRGPETPIANEYAWGSTAIVQATGIINQKMGSEVTTPENANCAYNYATGVMGPVRVGNFARLGSTRISSGASYYGILDLSGNLWERPVTVGNPTGRNFTGLNGDGTLDANGNANVTNWPGIDATGAGFRGGSWSASAVDYVRTSDRYFAANTYTLRYDFFGFRCVRAGE